jgi:hypothetical protein
MFFLVLSPAFQKAFQIREPIILLGQAGSTHFVKEKTEKQTYTPKLPSIAQKAKGYFPGRTKQALLRAFWLAVKLQSIGDLAYRPILSPQTPGEGNDHPIISRMEKRTARTWAGSTWAQGKKSPPRTSLPTIVSGFFFSYMLPWTRREPFLLQDLAFALGAFCW